MDDDFKLTNVMLTLLLVFVILFVGTAALQPLADGGSDTEDKSVGPLLDGAGSWVALADDVGKNERVVNSRGLAVELTGENDSYLQSDQDVNIATDQTWTASTWASVNNSAYQSNETMTAISAGSSLVITYNVTTDDWIAWYYDESSTDSYSVAVNATDQPSTLANIQVVRNNTSLTIYRNTTKGETVNITGSNQAPAPVESTTWHGRIDEFRTFDDALTSSERSDLHANPVEPVPHTNRTTRIMFDEPDGSQRIFYTSATLSTSQVSFVDGLDGEVMNGESLYNDITGKTDYQWDIVGPRIKPVEGGQLEHAPVAYIEYTAQSQLATFVDDWTQAIGIAGILFILLPLGTIIGYLTMMRDQR